MANITVTEGTQTQIYTENAGGVQVGVIKIDTSASGTYGVSMFQGTILKVNTLGTLPNLPGGTVDLVSGLNSGTINSATVVGGSIRMTVGTVSAGTINTGTINTGTINLGTIVGKDASAAAASGNPVQIGGTDSGGTVYSFKVDTKGQQFINSGTITKVEGGTLGEVTLVPTVTTVSNLTSGSVRMTVGTITVLPNIPGGTVDLVTTVSNISNGSIRMTVGTVNAGTINTGTINTGTINLGTVVGKDASAAASSGNPLQVGGTDSGGTVYAFKVDTKGQQFINSGTITKVEGGTLGEVTLVPTVTTVSNLTSGSVRMTVGTVTTGSIVVTAGTVATGSIAVTAGTVNTGTVNAGTINTGTVNAGTINAGTFTHQPYPASQVLSAGTTTAATIGTLVAAPGAGTGMYINTVRFNQISGTAETVLSFALQASGNQTLNRGNYAAGGGIAWAEPNSSYYGTANAALTWNILSGSGTISIAVTYYNKGTP